MKTDKNKKNKSLKTKLFLYFILFTAIIFSVLWLLQFVFLQNFYDAMLINNTRSAAEKIVQNSSSADITSFIDETAGKNSLLVYITDTDKNVLFISDEYKKGQGKKRMEAGVQVRDKEAHLRNGNYRSLPENFGEFTDALEQSENGVVELKDDGFYVYGSYIDFYGNDGKSVLYVGTALDAVGAAVNIIGAQLAIVTGLSVLTGFILAWLFSRKFSRPVARLSEKAKNLGEEGAAEVEGYKKGFCREIDDLNDTLDSTSVKLSEAKKFQMELLANVSHDLRTPLTMIKGYAEALEDFSDADAEQIKEDAGVIVKEADRLTALVNEIMEYSELKTKDGTVDLADVDLSAVAANTADSFEALFRHENVKLERDIAEGIHVNGKKSMLERMVYNLADNALRHTGADKRIRLSLSKDGDMAHLSVRDYGEGIPKKIAENIWDRYYTFRQRQGKGVSGLGLAIVKQTTGIHGGECYVESREGEGSTFTVEIPLLQK